MAANTDPIFPKEPLNNTANTSFCAELDNADGTNKVDLITGATDGTIINGINVSSDDTAAVDLLLYFYDGSNDYQLGEIEIPAGSGTDSATAAVSLLNETNLPAIGKRDDGSIFLAAGQKLKLAAGAAITAAKVVHAVCIGGNY